LELSNDFSDLSFDFDFFDDFLSSDFLLFPALFDFFSLLLDFFDFGD